MESQSETTESQLPMTIGQENILEPTHQNKLQENAVASEETKSPPNEKELPNENSSSKIWSEITSSRVKQIREVIEIIEQKSSASHNQEIPLQSSDQKTNSLPEPQNTSKPVQIKSNQAQTLRQKEDYWNKDSIQANELYFQYLVEQKENNNIHANKMKEFFEDKDQMSQECKDVQVKCIEMLMKKCLNNNEEQKSNVIRLIDLLYKKYILKPTREVLPFEQNEQKSFDIYKPEVIRGERYYRLNDNSLTPGLNLSNSQISDSNFFKRGASGRAYGENYVSLVDNESTNQPGDYLEAIASNYVNGIRKHKYSDMPGKGQFANNPQGANHDKYKKSLNNGLQNPLPFEIQIPLHTAKKQFNPGYNVFQGPDDEKNERFEEERTIAKTFVKDGYGLQIVRNYMQHMDGGSYNRAITTIIRESYKKIEDFLTKQCNAKIHSLTSSEFSLVKTPLVHCRNILRDQDKNTFFKYIAITYKFGKIRENDFPTAEETLSLYNAILRGLTDRKAAKELHQKPSKEKDMYFSR